ncbi:MAG TPA: DivIVA domain-containing protein [Acidimicrobiia bacterium]|nr:DivIVA domain-containing protein [Acidimicrobiia bacterium]
MGDDRLGPDTFSTRDLPTGRRGYEKKAVDALIARAVQEWGDLQRRHDDLLAEVTRSGGPEYLARDVSSVGEEVARVLQAAKEAADGMRTRAREDAERIERDSAADAAKQLEAAGSEAERVMAEAEQQAFDLRRDAWEAGDELIRSVQETIEQIVADAEAEALVIRAEAEREAHQRLAIARKEADDIVRNSRYEGDRLVTQARELAQQMIDRVGEAGGEGAPRGGVTRLSEEIERLHAERSIEDIAVLPAETRPARRSRSAAQSGEGASQPGDLSDELAAEVQELNDTPSPEPAADRGDDVGTLFDALRTTAEHEPVEMTRDPIALRDRLALPVHNGALREVKRRIVDLQTTALESLPDWSPDPTRITAELTAVVEPAIQKAAGAGASAAATLAGVQSARPLPGPRPAGLVGRMADDLTDQLVRARTADGGPSEVASVVSRVFRAWRGDEAERWVRTIVFAAYHDSLLSALSVGGWTEVTGRSSGRPCAGCAGHEELRWDPESGPPEGFAVPPANLDCSCTVTVPA